MRRILLTVLLTLALAPLLVAQDCTWCDLSIEPGKKVMWQRYAFCCKDCRHEWYLDRYRCKICNDKVEPKSSGGTRTDGVFVYIRIGPRTWDGYCDYCREGIKDGMIDPVKDRYVAPKKDNSLDDPVADKVKVESDTVNSDEAERRSGSYLNWALGLGVGAIFLIAKLLR